MSLFEQFTNPAAYAFQSGKLFLGLDPATGQEIGIQTDRHAVVIAGARSGKGAAFIAPNLKRWPHSALVIDPKGENAAITWADREAMGQTVAVLDPFKVADVPDRLRVGCNLLASIKPGSLTAREDMRGVADSMVLRFKATDATWDNGAVSVLAGFIDFVLNDPESEGERDLTAVRRLLTMEPDALEGCFRAMAALDTPTGLARAAASIGLSDSKKNKEFVSGAVDHSEWLDSPAMASILTGSGIDLAALKRGNMTLFLVLPAQYVSEHGRFLRLFVRAALDAMAKGLKGGKCLFLLDEFYSLGHIDQISKASGLMPGYGVHLVPILQDLGQLVSVYGREGAETFFGNSDAHVFFGLADALTMDYLSARMGQFGSKLHIRELIAKKDGDAVARSMVVIAKGRDVLNLALAPYFLDHGAALASKSKVEKSNKERATEFYRRLETRKWQLRLWSMIALLIVWLLFCTSSEPLFVGGGLILALVGLMIFDQIAQWSPRFENTPQRK